MAGKNGGARPGAGRKPTGSKTKSYTVTMPQELAEQLEKAASQNGKTVNKYILDLIKNGQKYSNVHCSSYQIDVGFQMAAEGDESSSYKVDSKKEKK